MVDTVDLYTMVFQQFHALLLQFINHKPQGNDTIYRQSKTFFLTAGEPFEEQLINWYISSFIDSFLKNQLRKFS